MPPAPVKPVSEATPSPAPIEIPVSDPLWVSIPLLGIERHPITGVADWYKAGKPATNDDINWWANGGKLGATSQNTPDAPGEWRYTGYFYGHRSDIDPDAVFGKLPKLAVEGAIIDVGGEAGIYHLKVVGWFDDAKTDVRYDPRYGEDVEGQYLFTSCYADDEYVVGSGGTTKTISIVAVLVGYTPNSKE